MVENEKVDIDGLLNEKKKIKIDSDSGEIEVGQDSFSLINSLLIVQMILLFINFLSIILNIIIFRTIRIYLSIYIMPLLIVILTIIAFYMNTMLKNIKNFTIVWFLIILNFIIILINYYDIIIGMF